MLHFIFSWVIHGSSAQNENTKWYFGAYAALDFMTNPPTVLNNSAMYSDEGCASIADAAGNLLFYTNGSIVWNKQHVIMANGTGLFGNNTTTQSSIIVKKPGSVNLYYIFTLAASADTTGLNYSIVDMSLAAGMGSVTVKNAPVYHAKCTEQMAATKLANGTGYWIMIHEYNSNKFRAYQLTASGLNTTAVISYVGTTYTHVYGSFKFSMSGKKLGTALYNLVELYDFNNNTGAVTNPIYLTTGGYGCEFSPDETKFYAAGIQWNLSSSSTIGVLSSSTAVYNNGNQLQLAPNGKIYLAGGLSIGVINNPDIGGVGCNITAQPVSATNTNNTNPITNGISYSMRGLPNMIEFPCQFSVTVHSGTVICKNGGMNNPSVSVSGNTAGTVSYLWSKGATTYTTAQINNLSAGSWNVNVADGSGCTVFRSLYVPQTPDSTSVSSSALEICAGNTIALNTNSSNSYTWSSGAHTQSLIITPTVTSQYSVSSTDQYGCIANSTTITINVKPVPEFSTSCVPDVCIGGTKTLTINYNDSTSSYT